MSLRARVPPFIAAATVVATIVLVAIAENAVVWSVLPHLQRLPSDFSPALLRYRIAALSSGPPQAIFLGDSVVWGYGLPPDRIATSILTSNGCACVNLAFKAGSPKNDYELLQLLLSANARPKIVVLQVNQRNFNPADQSYDALSPAIASIVRPPPPGIAAVLDRALGYWAVYATRADLRSLFSGDVDALPAQPPKPDDFLGTYDLAALSASNASVRYLAKTAALLRDRGIPATAFLTPTNHALLREYIDAPAYRANARYLVRLLESYGVRVLDLDRAFDAADFIDNDHLTARGQRRLAAVLSRAIPELGAP